MTQLSQKFSELSNRAKDLDEQALDFSKKMREFAEDLEKSLNRRRKKYSIDVRLEESFDFTSYQIDIFIRLNDQSIHYVFTMSMLDEFDEDEILREIDNHYKGINA